VAASSTAVCERDSGRSVVRGNPFRTRKIRVLAFVTLARPGSLFGGANIAAEPVLRAGLSANDAIAFGLLFYLPQVLT
jgi:hypothetical protein